MKDKILDLRQDFHDWLIRQGLSEKTKAGRPGTVYEYIKRLDRLSQNIFNKVDWCLLGRDIDVLTVFHKMYGLKKYRKYPMKRTLNLITYHFSFQGMSLNKDKLQRLKKYAQKLEGRIAEVKNNQIALLKFCKYLSDLQKPGAAKSLDAVLFNKPSQRTARKLAKIKVAYSHDYGTIFQILKLSTYDQVGNPLDNSVDVLPATPTAAKRIKDYTPKSYLLDADIAELLEVSDLTLERLKEGKIRGFKLNTRSARIINRYLKKHHHPCWKGAFIGQKKGEPDKWLTAAETAKRLGCSMSYVKKLRLQKRIAFIQNSPRTFRYSPQDVERLLEEQKNRKNK